ncbi:hypothetical protein GJAV_G00239650 [Gymnothorax javanicus]|nr:hypothetical protein GJAV_G00239650 [Gymnothorax javanicus]
MTADKPSDVLKDVIAFVDVWSSSRTENYAKPFIEQLLEMGAEVSKTFDKHVTHVVFKNGRQSTWNKAKKTGVKLVSVLWVARCKECREHIDEDLCPALNEGSHNNPALSKRTHRCMQPRDIPEQTVENNKSMKRKLDRMMKSLEVSSPSSPDVSPFLIDEENGIVYSPSSRRARDMAQRLKVMREKRESLSRTDSREEDDSSDLDTSFSDFHSSSVGSGEAEGRHSHKKRALDSGVTRSNVEIDQSVPESLTGTGTEKMTLVNCKYKRETVEHPSLQGFHGKGKRPKLQKLSDSSTKSSVYEHQTSVESPRVDLFCGEGAISRSAAGLNRTRRGSSSSSSKCEQAEKVTLQSSCDPGLCGEGNSRSPVKMTRILDMESSDPCGPMKSSEARSLLRDHRRSTKKTLVITSMSIDMRDTVVQVVSSLGRFSLVDSVGEGTTHVVTGRPRRTLSVLLGIARGCWILSFEWIVCSLEQGHWVSEEPFELSSDFPAASICRLQQHLSAGEHQQDLFSRQPAMFVSPQSQPPPRSLTELIQLCGGTVCRTLRQAGICIGLHKGKKPEGMRSLSELWVLDCLTHLKELPYDNYDLDRISE